MILRSATLWVRNEERASTVSKDSKNSCADDKTVRNPVQSDPYRGKFIAARKFPLKVPLTPDEFYKKSSELLQDSKKSCADDKKVENPSVKIETNCEKFKAVRMFPEMIPLTPQEFKKQFKILNPDLK